MAEKKLYRKGFVTGRYLDNGKPERIWVSSVNKKAFENKCATVKADIQRGVYIKTSDTLFKDYAQEWLKLKKSTVSVQRYEHYMYTIKNHMGSLNMKHLKNITYSDIQSLVSSESSQYIQYDIRITVNQIMKMALKDDLIYKNPADGVKSKPIKHKEKRALMDTEKKAISRLKKSRVFTPTEQLYIDTLFITGCRPDEALALMKSDVKENVVSVSKALTWRGGKILKDTKSNAGNRKIDVPMWYQKEVDSYDAEGSLYLFHGRDGGLIPENTYKKLWKSIKEKIKNEIKLDTGLVPYIFRHNYVTMLYYSGVSLKEAQRMAGHANASITLEIYSHLDSEKENTAEKIKDFAI